MTETLPQFLTSDASFVEDVSKEVAFAIHSPSAIESLRSLSEENRAAKWRRVEIETFFFQDSRSKLITHSIEVLKHFAHVMCESFAITDIRAHLHRVTGCSQWFESISNRYQGLLQVRLLLICIAPDASVPLAIDAETDPYVLRRNADMTKWVSGEKQARKGVINGTETRITVHSDAVRLMRYTLVKAIYGNVFEQMIGALNVGRLVYARLREKGVELGTSIDHVRLDYNQRYGRIVIMPPVEVYDDVDEPSRSTLVIKHPQGCLHDVVGEFYYGKAFHRCSKCELSYN